MDEETKALLKSLGERLDRQEVALTEFEKKNKILEEENATLKSGQANDQRAIAELQEQGRVSTADQFVVELGERATAEMREAGLSSFLGACGAFTVSNGGKQVNLGEWAKEILRGTAKGSPVPGSTHTQRKVEGGNLSAETLAYLEERYSGAELEAAKERMTKFSGGEA